MSLAVPRPDRDLSSGLAAGELASEDQLASARLHTVAEGPAAGTRVLIVQVAGGLSARVLLDRGMDLGRAEWGGWPVAWLSARGERRPGATDTGEGWHRGWAGGLLTTCGLRNVGPPGEGFGRHGDFTDQPAEDVSVRRAVDGDGRPTLVVEGTVRDGDALGPGLVVRRTLTWAVGAGQVELCDRTVNASSVSVQAPILYHVNFGAPFLCPASRTFGSEAGRGAHGSGGVRAGGAVGGRDEDGRFVVHGPFGPPADVPDVVESPQVGSSEGWAWLALDSERTGMEATVSWETAGLPLVHTWRRRVPGAYVQAIEPANATVLGRAADRAGGVAPWLEPGAARTTRMCVRLSRKVFP